jgi:hypothetical protein
MRLYCFKHAFTLVLQVSSVLCASFLKRFLKISLDPYPDFTDPEPVFSYHAAIVNRHSFLLVDYVTDHKFSLCQIKKFIYRQIPPTPTWDAGGIGRCHFFLKKCKKGEGKKEKRRDCKMRDKLKSKRMRKE